MNSIITPDIQEVMNAVHYRPAVSIIMPIESKSNFQNQINHILKTTIDKVERELYNNYPDELCKIVVLRLKTIIKDFKFDLHKKAVVIYVSPVFEKILYLDVPVEEKIIIDESFEIRDLVYSKQQLHKYLVLLLSNKESRVFIGNATVFVKIKSSIPENESAYVNEGSERVSNFSDPSEHKEILMKKFLHHVDTELDTVLNAYHLPLFVIGADRLMGHFKQLTKHGDAVTEYIHGNYENASIPELKKILEPHIANWKKAHQKNLIEDVDAAAGQKRLAIGIKDVWHEAMNEKGKLLVVEKNYMYAAQHGHSKDVIYNVTDDKNSFYIKDAVDDIIEAVLEKGGDIDFVEKGLLKKYQHIALIKYY